ncbi:MAG: bifunctional folylpolyglutamate synthase/dihydrofolate synthase [Campylobacteraceae bacterium]|nr:bifunctional folylpolyglutamate synthase/dihydrofolate synthase [Campylobacteraceae bacterium]
MTVFETLAKKPLFSSTIDTSRMPRIYAKIASKLNLPPVVHIVGTNGKGSTGRFLALMMKDLKICVGHYTSPHIKNINERFWIDGECVEDASLEKNHIFLKEILSKEDFDELSYFEYLTLLAPLVFKDCDTVILEAGLGGEFDATNVFPKSLSIVTTIGLDHQSFLGDTIEEIASTKLRSVNTTTLLSKEQTFKVKKIAKEIAYKKELPLLFTKDLVCDKTLKEIDAYIIKLSYPDFLKSNLQTAYAAARALHLTPNIKSLSPLDLRGRFEQYSDNIILDCGHNPLAASALFKALPNKKYNFIYNAYEDKDVEAVLKILAPKIKSLFIMPLEFKGRESSEKKIEKTARELKIETSLYDFKINPKDFYVVFGSFAVIEGFLKATNA